MHYFQCMNLLTEFYFLFLRRGGVNVPNRTIEEIVTSPVCGALISWTWAHSGTTVVLLRIGVLLGPLATRDHILVRIAYRKLRRHPNFSTIPFIQVPVS